MKEVIKFDDIKNGTVDKKLSLEDINDSIRAEINKFETLKELNDFIVGFAPSDAYRIIRDIVCPKTNKLIIEGRLSKKEEYQRFQDIQSESKRIFEYEQKSATMYDVQNISGSIAKQYYSITLRMISLLDDELGKIEQAINKIEEAIGISVTDFNKEEHNDTTESINEQGIEENTQ